MTELTKRLKGSTAIPVDPLKADFRNFLYAVWKHLGLPDPTPLQYDIAAFLQHGPKRLVVEAFRGVGKSWITVAFVCWLLYCDPQLKITVVSASAPRAKQFTFFCLQLINDMALLAHLKPRHGQRQSTEEFDVAPARADKQPSVSSLGVTGQLTGGRADVLVPDDIEVPHNSDTQGKRDRLLELIKEFDAMIKPLPTSRICYLGTPQTEQSIYNELSSRGYVLRIWPSRFPAKLERYGARLAPYILKKLEQGAKPWEPTDPGRFSNEDLTERELSYGRSGYALQFQLDTSLSDAEKFPLKLSDLIVHPLDPYRASIDFMWAGSPDLAWDDKVPIVGLHGDRYYRPAWFSPEAKEYEGCVMSVDPSGRGKDETSYAVVKVLHGRMFLVAAGGYVGGYDEETLKGLLMVAKRHHVPQIIAEPNYGGGMFTELLKSAAQRYYPCGIEDAEWNSVAKEQRIVDTLEPIMNQHRLVVCPSVIQSDYDSVLKRDGDRVPYYRLFYQMSRMVRQRGALAQDDRLDALAMAVNFWTMQAARDINRAAVEHHEAKLDAELAKFMKHAMGGQTKTGRQFASSVLKKVH